MRGVYTNSKLNWYLYPHWKTGELWQPPPLFFTWLLKSLLKSSFKWKVASRWAFNRNLFYHNNRIHWHSPLFTLPATWHRWTATRETKFIMLLNILDISHLNVIRDADWRMGRSLTNSWWCNSFCTKQRSRVPLTAFLRGRYFSRHDLRSAITEPVSTLMAPQGSNSELCRTASTAATAVFNMLISFSQNKNSLCE